MHWLIGKELDLTIVYRSEYDWLVVQGDASTAAVGSLVAYYRRVRIAHVEAGIRSYDKYSPFPGLNKGNRPFLSIKMAAELAGCGSPSLAGPVLHSDYGFMYYSAIVTTLPMEPDSPPERPACPAPVCLDQWEAEGTTPCMQVCPIGDGGCLGGKIEEGKILEREYDSARCNARVHTYWVPGFQKVLEAALEQTDKEKRKMILYGNFFTRTLWSITYAAQSQGQCLECMRVCPVGAEYRNLK